jgi:hypothetical protein
MASKECFHFTTLDRMYSIKNNGLQCRLEDNSKSVGDSKSKISFSDSNIGAIGLYANFEQVYLEYKIGKRPKHNTPEELQMKDKILATKNMEEFLGDGLYLVFDGTGIENEGGNTGKGGIYDASTRTSISAQNLKVGLIKNNDTGEYSYSRTDYIHYLMANLKEEEYSQMIEPMQERYDAYCEAHKDEIEKFKTGNYTRGSIPLDKFCIIYKNDIDKAIHDTQSKSSIEKEDDDYTH